MKLTKDQITKLQAKSTVNARSRVADAMLEAKKPLTKPEIATLAAISGSRPEHNVSSQFTYLRTEGYIIEEVNPKEYMILALPDLSVPEYAQTIVAERLKWNYQQSTKSQHILSP